MKIDVKMTSSESFNAGFGEAQIIHGMSAYQIAVKNGFAGTEEEWLESLKGENGKDGVSATHSWNGTVLEVTSASGTSSVDLKGEKGDTGEAGTPGKDGYTPQKGVDYFTPEDIDEIHNTPIKSIKFTNGVELVISDELEFGLAFGFKGEKSTFYDAEHNVFAIEEALFAWKAQCDGEGNDIVDTYVKKDEVKTEIQTYIDEAILGGAW